MLAERIAGGARELFAFSQREHILTPSRLICSRLTPRGTIAPPFWTLLERDSVRTGLKNSARERRKTVQMAGNAKRTTKKLREMETIFTALPKVHRTRPVWEALSKVSSPSKKNQERATAHLQLALALIEAGSNG